MQGNDLVQRLRDRAYGCKVPDPLVEEAADEIDRLRLTDAEREAIKSSIWDYEQSDDDEDCARMVSTLCGLLDRTKDGAK